MADLFSGLGMVKCSECTFNPNGHCHLYPPKPFLIGARNALGENVPQIIAALPPVSTDGFCCEGVRRPIAHQD